ncbi:hypothetical protein DLI07_05135 [Vibrio parahaemolyticus]|nr:hypothetical protein [Vibrio parahaemolyticus]EGQ8279595.1 hypothetical protein [Vibrio parahaemolyticus]EGQ8715574.1 hypothetical protein [Vibrio parahaemolyticus]EGQ8808964.1 hypothetical protein [Vibrio parahaemolyticus]EGQ8837418.1 hypothetical protein [Vibrio parahaemolyticus]
MLNLVSREGWYDIRNARYFDPLPNSQELMDLASTTPLFCDFCHLNVFGVGAIKIVLHISCEKFTDVNEANVIGKTLFA